MSLVLQYVCSENLRLDTSEEVIDEFSRSLVLTMGSRHHVALQAPLHVQVLVSAAVSWIEKENWGDQNL